MTEELKLEPLSTYTLDGPLVEAVFNYLGTQPSAQVEGLRSGIYQQMFQQQQAAALAKLSKDAPLPKPAAAAVPKKRKNARA